MLATLSRRPVPITAGLLLLMALTALCACSRSRAAAHSAMTGGPAVARRPEAPPMPAGALPAPSGPVITVDDDHPYNAQGVAATTVLSWKGDAAPSGYHYLLVTLAVVPPVDGPPLEAGFTDYDLGILYPGCGSNCFNSLERAVPYATHEELRNRTLDEGRADSGQLLEPGTSYYATLHQQIPSTVELNAVRLCRSGMPDGVCVPLASLPKLAS